MFTEEEVIEEYIEFFKNSRTDDEFIYLDLISSLSFTGNRSIEINFQHLKMWDDLTEKKLAEILLINPASSIEFAGEAIKKLVKEYDDTGSFASNDFNARYSHIPAVSTIHSLRSRHLEKLYTVEGMIIRMSGIRSLIIEAAFRCVIDPMHIVVKNQIDGVYSPPKSCSYSCKSKQFSLIKTDSKYIDRQTLLVQELPENLEGRTNPKSIFCVFLDDIVGKVRPGQRILVSGILNTKSIKAKRKGEILDFDFKLDVNYFRILDENPEDILSEFEEEKFTFLSRRENLMPLLVNSFSSELYGLEKEKEALLYFLAGSDDQKGQAFNIRGRINILLLGDPSLGKSQLLKSVSAVFPRAIYTSGKGSSAAGLTAAVIRDSFSGEFILEAGAMVLADRGLTLIDEFDKMNKLDRSAIHEAMEQGTVSIAKAGIVATLNSRTGVLAAANPKNGYYSPKETLLQNTNLSTPILSRFDLIFVFQDSVNEKKDRDIVNHISDGIVHKERLCLDDIKKYVSLSKKFNPVLSQEAIEELKDYYIQKRSEEVSDHITITTRQYESLLRLTKARARLHLREKATVEDAREIILLMEYALRSSFLNPNTKEVDISQLSGYTSQKRNKLGRIHDVLRALGREKKSFSMAEAIEAAEKKGVNPEEAEKYFINLLREATMIYSPKPGYISLLN